MKYLMGVDIGTTAIKAIIIDTYGNVVVKSSCTYALIMPKPGWVEQEPEAMWTAVLRAMEQAIDSFPGDRGQIAGVSLSTQRDTLICVDEKNHPVRNAITWMDSRSTAECAALANDVGEQRVYTLTGVGISTIWTLAFILWLRAHEPANFARTACFGLVHDFILCRMGAKEHVLDSSNACQTMLYDFRAGIWSRELMDYAGLRADQLPRLVEPGTPVGRLSPALARRLGLPGDVALVSGGGDQQLAALGAGAVKAGDVEIGIGTAANLLALSNRPISDPQKRMICHRAAVSGMWVLEGAMLAMGRLLEWVKKEVFFGAPLCRIDESIAAESAPGAGGLTVLPHFEGAACPYWNAKATGLISGFRLSSSRADIARAVMESTAFEIRKSLELLDGFDLKTHSVRVSGGASKSPVWMQILADILEVEVEIPQNPDCAALGAAILAGIGCGLFRDAGQAAGEFARVARAYQPQTGHRAMYRAAYQKNRALYQVLDQNRLF